MKKIAQVVEVAEDGLESFLGEHIMVFCANYIYCGILDGINNTFIKLTDAHIVYETGSFADKSYKDKQLLPSGVAYVMIHAIEHFGPGKR